MSSEGLHEPIEKLSDGALNLHRAIVSLMEELEAVDWYNQRAEGCTDPELTKILEHNRDEEIEHACMALEWLRRRIPAWDENLRTYLFTEAPITEIDELETGGSGREDSGGGDLGIGKL